MTTSRLPCPTRNTTAPISPQQCRVINDYTPMQDSSTDAHPKRQSIKRGDIIDAGNGLSVVVHRVEPYEAWVDLCLGGQRLDVFPIHLAHSFCAEYHGISLSFKSPQLVIEPVYKNFVKSKQDTYAGCMQSGEPHSKCSDFIPYSPAPTETSLRNGKFQMITHSDANPLIGAYYFQQLLLTFRQVQDFFGFSEVTPFVSLRWMRLDGGWNVPNTSQQVKIFPAHPSTEASEVAWIQDNQAGGIDTIAGNDLVVHELTHLLFYGMSLPYYMQEGLARFAEFHITQRPKPAAKLRMTIPMNASARVAGLTPPLQFTTIGRNSLGQPVVFSPTLNQWFTEKSYALVDGDKMITVETIAKKGVAIRLFDSVKTERKQGWIFQFWVSCQKDGYFQQLAAFIGNVHYVKSQYSEEGEFQKMSYMSLREGRVGKLGNGPLYDTAYCMYEGIYQLYGKRAIHDFLARADKVRQDNLNAIPTNFCAVRELEAATHHDLSDYLRPFDPPKDCFSTWATIPLLKGMKHCPDKR